MALNTGRLISATIRKSVGLKRLKPRGPCNDVRHL